MGDVHRLLDPLAEWQMERLPQRGEGYSLDLCKSEFDFALTLIFLLSRREQCLSDTAVFQVGERPHPEVRMPALCCPSARKGCAG
jgi:hypothetical protein